MFDTFHFWQLKICLVNELNPVTALTHTIFMSISRTLISNVICRLLLFYVQWVEVNVRLVDIGGIVDYHWLNFFLCKWTWEIFPSVYLGHKYRNSALIDVLHFSHSKVFNNEYQFIQNHFLIPHICQNKLHKCMFFPDILWRSTIQQYRQHICQR